MVGSRRPWLSENVRQSEHERSNPHGSDMVVSVRQDRSDDHHRCGGCRFGRADSALTQSQESMTKPKAGAADAAMTILLRVARHWPPAPLKPGLCFSMSSAT